MPIPQLDTNYAATGSDDMMNNVVKMQYMKGLTESNQALNAYRQANTQSAQLDSMTKLFNHGREGLTWVKGNVDLAEDTDTAEKYYNSYRDHMISMGMPESYIPESQAFLMDDPESPGDTIWNNDAFDAWAGNTARTAKEFVENKGQSKMKPFTLYNTKKGATLLHWAEEGEDVDPAALYGEGWTFEKPTYEKGSDSEMLTIYGPGGQTKRVAVKKGEDFTPPKGWSLKAPREVNEADTAMKEEKLRLQIQSDANKKAIRETNLKYKDSVTFTTDENGRLKPDFVGKSADEARTYYLQKIQEHETKGIEGAVKRGALSKTHLPENAEGPTPAEPAASAQKIELPGVRGIPSGWTSEDQNRVNREWGPGARSNSTRKMGDQNANFTAALNYFKGATSRADAINRIKALKAQGWSYNEMKLMEGQSGLRF